MRVSPRLKYPLVAGIGTTKSSVAVATRAAKMAAAAILNALDEVNLVGGFCGICFSFKWYHSVIIFRILPCSTIKASPLACLNFLNALTTTFKSYAIYRSVVGEKKSLLLLTFFRSYISGLSFH